MRPAAVTISVQRASLSTPRGRLRSVDPPAARFGVVRRRTVAGPGELPSLFLASVLGGRDNSNTRWVGERALYPARPAPPGPETARRGRPGRARRRGRPGYDQAPRVRKDRPR